MQEECLCFQLVAVKEVDFLLLEGVGSEMTALEAVGTMAVAGALAETNMWEGANSQAEAGVAQPGAVDMVIRHEGGEDAQVNQTRMLFLHKS